MPRRGTSGRRPRARTCLVAAGRVRQDAAEDGADDDADVERHGQQQERPGLISGQLVSVSEAVALSPVCLLSLSYDLANPARRKKERATRLAGYPYKPDLGFQGHTHKVRSTPTFPFVIPPSDRKSSACVNEVEKPKPRHEITGEPHQKPVPHSHNLKKIRGTHSCRTGQSLAPSSAHSETSRRDAPTSWR